MSRQTVQRLKRPSAASAWPMIARCMWRQWQGIPQEYRIKIVDLCNRPEDDEQDLTATLTIIYNRIHAHDIGRYHRSWMEYDFGTLRMRNLSAPVMSIKEEIWLTR